jgi:pimeloyl-ACP methyl ester carboxylesterase
VRAAADGWAAKYGSKNMPVIKAGVFDLEYTDTGAGPAVVLVHSSASGHRQWRRLVETLQTRYRLIAVNLFGYGKTSSWPNARPLSTADQAELVAAVSTLAPEPVALIGHSLGGAVALEAAAKLSDRIRVLVRVRADFVRPPERARTRERL